MSSSLTFYTFSFAFAKNPRTPKESLEATA